MYQAHTTRTIRQARLFAKKIALLSPVACTLRKLYVVLIYFYNLNIHLNRPFHCILSYIEVNITGLVPPANIPLRKSSADPHTDIQNLPSEVSVTTYCLPD